MRAADTLIEEIVTSSRIPSGSRRREVVRELRSHVEDFVLVARDGGHSDDEIERMVLANFGDPRQMGRNFAWVYRRERAILGLAVFSLSTLVVATVVAAGTLAMQAGVALGFGRPVLQVLATRHTIIEAIDILATVAAYVGFISLEHLFARRRFQKAIAFLSLIFTILMCGFALAGIRTSFLIFGFANAIFLRTVQEFLGSWVARLCVVLAYFGLFAVIFLWFRSPGYQYSFAASLMSWLIMGVGYQLMTGFAARIDRELSSRLQQL